MAVEAQYDLKIEEWVSFVCPVKGGFPFECSMCDWPVPHTGPEQAGRRQPPLAVPGPPWHCRGGFAKASGVLFSSDGWHMQCFYILQHSDPFKSGLRPFPVWPPARDLTSLGLGFLLCKLARIISTSMGFCEDYLRYSWQSSQHNVWLSRKGAGASCGLIFPPAYATRLWSPDVWGWALHTWWASWALDTMEALTVCAGWLND